MIKIAIVLAAAVMLFIGSASAEAPPTWRAALGLEEAAVSTCFSTGEKIDGMNKIAFIAA